MTASGTAPLTYQWSRGGAPISGATGSSYTTPATVLLDSGASFTVKVTNSAGSTTSAAAILTVKGITPIITAQPQNQRVVVGNAASFSVIASGTPTPTYQWSKNGTPIGGATGATYTTPVTVLGDNGAIYTVVRDQQRWQYRQQSSNIDRLGRLANHYRPATEPNGGPWRERNIFGDCERNSVTHLSMVQK